MATIRARKQSDGTTRYTAIVRIRKRKTIIYQEYKTFALRTAAVSWAKHQEVQLEKPGALYRAQHGTPTLAGTDPVVHRYLRDDLQLAAKQAHEPGVPRGTNS